MIKPKFLNMYMEMAETAAKYSSATRNQVGTIIVKDDRIISIGINGTRSGHSNICETSTINPDGTANLVTHSEVLHSEANAISKLAKSTDSGEGTYIFCTLSPCLSCALQLAEIEPIALYYRHVYRNKEGLLYMQKCNIPVYHLPSN